MPRTAVKRNLEECHTEENTETDTVAIKEALEPVKKKKVVRQVKAKEKRMPLQSIYLNNVLRAKLWDLK